MSRAYAYMLDTNAASTVIRGRAATALQKLLLEQGACISVITEAELRFGVKRRPDATRIAKAVDMFFAGHSRVALDLGHGACLC